MNSLMSSGEPSGAAPMSESWSDIAHRDVNLRAEARARMVTQMTEYARCKQLDVTEELVSKHYRWFFRWYTGAIAEGYLMGRTGVKRKAVNIDHWSE